MLSQLRLVLFGLVYLFMCTVFFQIAGKLVKKSDQIRAILSASILFADQSEKKLENEFFKCFRKCDRIASTLLDTSQQVQLYIEILSQLTMYLSYENGSEVQALIDSLFATIEEKKQNAVLPELVSTQLDNTMKYLKKKGKVSDAGPPKAVVASE